MIPIMQIKGLLANECANQFNILLDRRTHSTGLSTHSINSENEQIQT